MVTIPLQRLHNRKIQLAIEIDQQLRFFQGKGEYEFRPDAGWVLIIHVADQLGEFSFVLQEASWKGPVIPGTSKEYDYMIQLTESEPRETTLLNS
jgi:hypothetical protein